VLFFPWRILHLGDLFSLQQGFSAASFPFLGWKRMQGSRPVDCL